MNFPFILPPLSIHIITLCPVNQPFILSLSVLFYYIIPFFPIPTVPSVLSILVPFSFSNPYSFHLYQSLPAPTIFKKNNPLNPFFSYLYHPVPFFCHNFNVPFQFISTSLFPFSQSISMINPPSLSYLSTSYLLRSPLISALLSYLILTSSLHRSPSQSYSENYVRVVSLTTSLLYLFIFLPLTAVTVCLPFTVIIVYRSFTAGFTAAFTIKKLW